MTSPSSEPTPVKQDADTPVTQVEQTDEAVVVRVQVRDLDDRYVRRVKDDASSAAQKDPAKPVIVELSVVRLIPSLTLGALVRMSTEFKARNQRLMLAGLQPGVRQIMSITKLDRMFEIHDDLESALRTLRH